MSELTRISTDQAIAVLFEDATRGPDRVTNKLAKAAHRNPQGMRALLKAAGVAAFGDVAAAAALKRFPLVIGQAVTEQGIPFSQFNSGRRTINLNLIPDYLRDASGAPIALTGNEAIEAVAALNGGLKCGNGYEHAIARAVSGGEFKDGTLILARREDLLRIACERETNPALKQMNEMIVSGSYYDSWCVSSTENSDCPSNAYHVRLKDGNEDWFNKGNSRSRVVVLRGFNCG